MSTEKFRERLRKIARGNYKDLARRADILPSRMQRLKGGVEPVIGMVIALARAGGVSVQWLATGEGTKETRARADAEQKPHVAIRSVPNGWRKALEALDEVCTKYRVVLARSTKAQAAVLIYEFFGDLDRLETDQPDDRTRRRAKVVQLLKKLENQAPHAPDEGKALE